MAREGHLDTAADRVPVAGVTATLGYVDAEPDCLAGEYRDLYREADVEAHRVTLRPVPGTKLRV